MKILRAILILPGTVAVAVPVLILIWQDLNHDPIQWATITSWRFWIGIPIAVTGFSIFIWTVRLFATIGNGTLAPWEPTQRLVVSGPYRHVRNPMITAVGSVLIAECIFSGSLPLFFWFALFVAGNACYFPLVEEPGLYKRFGDDYLAYKRNVPRWIPRIRPWTPNPAP